MKEFLLWVVLSLRNLKFENFTTLFDKPRQKIAPKSVPHVQHDYFSLFNQSNYSFVALSLALPSTSWFLKLHSSLNYIQPHVTNLQWETISTSPLSSLDSTDLTSLSLCCLIFISTRHRAWESGAVFVASWRSLPSVRYSSCFSLMFAWVVWIVL